MAWQIRFSKKAAKTLKKLDKTISSQIISYLEEVTKLENPRVKGKALTGNLAGFWRYRVGNYRIVCLIEDEELIIFTFDIGHRKNIYN